MAGDALGRCRRPQPKAKHHQRRDNPSSAPAGLHVRLTVWLDSRAGEGEWARFILPPAGGILVEHVRGRHDLLRSDHPWRLSLTVLYLLPVLHGFSVSPRGVRGCLRVLTVASAVKLLRELLTLVLSFSPERMPARYQLGSILSPLWNFDGIHPSPRVAPKANRARRSLGVVEHRRITSTITKRGRHVYSISS